METLKEKEQEKIQYGLLLLKTQVRLSKKFVKHIRDGVYELRTEYGNNIFRVFFIFDEGKIVVLFNGFQKKLLSMDFVQAMENTGLTTQMANRILNRFAPLQEKWNACIDSSFISENQKTQLKALINERITRIKNSF